MVCCRVLFLVLWKYIVVWLRALFLVLWKYIVVWLRALFLVLRKYIVVCCRALFLVLWKYIVVWLRALFLVLWKYIVVWLRALFLALCFFVLFINDLSDCVKNGSEIYLYADDTKIFKVINDADDCRRLQDDLKQVHKWTEDWQQYFHPEKCKQMIIGKANVEDQEYTMSNTLTKTHKEKDIRVVTDDKLNFSDHF